MGGVTATADLPTVEWLTRLSEANESDMESFRKLGEVDCRFAINILDGKADGSALSVQVTFEEFSVTEIKEVNQSDLDSLDFVLETDSDGWQEMVDAIRAGSGRPDLDHTLNALSITGTPIRLWSTDTLGKDMFYRYSQSMQHFINNSARL